MIPNSFYLPGKYSADLAVISRCLSTNFSGKRPLFQALLSLAEQRQLNRLGPALRLVALKLQSGSSPFQAFSDYEISFGTFFCHVVRQGELSENPPFFFSGLADYYESNDRFRNKILLTLKYPAIMIIGATAVIVSLLAVIIPAAARLIPENSTALPSVTRIALQVLTIQPPVLLVFLISVALVFSLAWYPPVYLLLEKLRLEIPFFGDLFRKNLLRRIARTLSFLLSNGVNPYTALEMTAASISHTRYADNLFESAREKPEKGCPPESVDINFNGIFPQTASDSFSNNPDPCTEGKRLRKTADFYEEEIETAVTAITLFGEPAIIAVAGLLGGGILAVLYLPHIHNLVGG